MAFLHQKNIFWHTFCSFFYIHLVHFFTYILFIFYIHLVHFFTYILFSFLHRFFFTRIFLLFYTNFFFWNFEKNWCNKGRPENRILTLCLKDNIFLRISKWLLCILGPFFGVGQFLLQLEAFVQIFIFNNCV